MADTRRLNQLRDETIGDMKLPGGRLVVALSGGADSAALAWLVKGSGSEARAVHVDHGLTHSGTMSQAAMSVAAFVGLDLTIIETNVPAGPSPEGQARSARYLAFNSGVGEVERLLTAHTAEDSAETLIHNLARGTGLRGLTGIPYFRPPNIYRPLLDVTGDVLREIAVLAALPFVDDPMNFDSGLTRNHIRHQVMPRLREINPSIAVALRRMTHLLRSDDETLDNLAALPASRGPRRFRVAIGDLLARPRGLSERFLATELADMEGIGPVSSEMLGRVWSVIEGSTGRQQISGRVEGWREGPFLVVGANDDDSVESVLIPGEHRSGGLTYEVLRMDGACRVAPLSRWHALFPVATELTVGVDRKVYADGELAWEPGMRRWPVAWYVPGDVGYLSVFAKEDV